MIQEDNTAIEWRWKRSNNVNELVIGFEIE